MADSEPIEGKPLSHPGDKLLIEAYQQEIIKQSERFEAIAKDLLQLELAIPGLYVAALQFIKTPESLSTFLIVLTFLFWFLALVLTIVALLPKRWSVLDHTVRRTQVVNKTDDLTIEEYFQESTKFKRKFVIASILAFFTGMIIAALSVLWR